MFFAAARDRPLILYSVARAAAAAAGSGVPYSRPSVHLTLSTNRQPMHLAVARRPRAGDTALGPAGRSSQAPRAPHAIPLALTSLPDGHRTAPLRAPAP